MSHALDKETVNRILHLHRVQGLEARVIAERFGFSSSRVHSVIRRKLQAGLAARAQRDAAQFNLKLKLKNNQSSKPQASSTKPQAPSASKRT